MHARGWILVTVILLAGLAAPTFGADGGAARSCAASVATVQNVSTEGFSNVTARGVVLEGEARVNDSDEFTGWFQYRAVGSGGDWRTTNRTEVATNACGQGWFEASLAGLTPNTTYEYRTVVATGNDTARGDVKTFRTASRSTAEATVTPTRTPTELTQTPTPVPCPSFRGAGSLCTRTPTPTASPVEGPSSEGDDVRKVPPGLNPGLVEWFEGLLPAMAWMAAVVVLAPLVLGGLLGLDSLRGER